MEWREKLSIDAASAVFPCAGRRSKTPLNNGLRQCRLYVDNKYEPTEGHDVQPPARAPRYEPVMGRLGSTRRANVPLQPGTLVGDDVGDIFWVERLPVV